MVGKSLHDQRMPSFGQMHQDDTRIVYAALAAE